MLDSVLSQILDWQAIKIGWTNTISMQVLLKQLELLTVREQEVFTLFGQGFNTMQAAEKLEISPYTVQTHRNHLKEKLNLKTTDELNFLAYQWVGSRISGLD